MQGYRSQEIVVIVSCLLLVPTAEEVVAVQPHEADKLDVTGKLFKALAKIPRLKERLDCQFITFTWEQGVYDIERDLQIVTNALSEIRRAMDPIKLLLEVILSGSLTFCMCVVWL
jgi:hypothetical protein